MNWLTKYYSRENMKDLNPTIFAEGRARAVVRLCHDRELRYVLVEKSSRHDAAPAVVLHEGPAPIEKMHEMRRMVSRARSQPIRLAARSSSAP